MKLKPFPGFLIVKPHDDGGQTDSGIVLPETADKDKPERGIVLAVGDPRRRDNGGLDPSLCVEGDQILFRKFSPDEVKLGEDKYLIVEETDVMAKITE